MKKLNIKGFTLIELMVVVLIIGILAAIALPQYRTVIKKTKLTEALTIISNIQKGIDLYILEQGWPEERVNLVGENSTSDKKANILTIDVEAPLTCVENDGCHNNEYIFSAFCEPTSCTIQTYRMVNHDPARWSDGMSAYKRKEENDWYKEFDPMSEKTLNEMLFSQGWRQC